MNDTGMPDLDRLEALFQEALDLPPGERDDFLDEHLGDEPDLREELRTLLAHAATDPGFLDRMAHRVVAPASEQALSEIQPRRLDEDLQGRYRVEGEIGRGGMATVYLAHDVRHHRRVALKVLDPRLATVLGPERFLAEIRTTANLQHPHILPLFDSGEAAGSLFYVMPYVEGESLRARLDREMQLPVEEAVRIAAEVADALDHAHRQGVIHRDIKPGNILLREGGALVADFGIALATRAAGGERLTETGLSLGTPHYMSPEQATGSHEVGPASDLYALGCLLYEMLAGEPPHTGSTAQAVVAKILSGEVKPVRAERPTVPPHVEAGIARALERLPADRFRSAGEMKRALNDPAFRWGEVGVGGPTRPPAFWQRTAVALAVLALALALGLVWPRIGPDIPEPVRYASIVLPPAGSIPDEGLPLEIARDGSRLVFSLSTPDGGRALWTRSFSEPEAVPIPGTEGAGDFFLAPDGEWVAFHDPVEGEIVGAPVRGGGGLQRIVSIRGATFRGGTWGPDGVIVYATDSGLWSVPIEEGIPRELTSVDSTGDTRHRQPRFLPDGTGLVFTETELSAFPVRHRIALLRPEEGVTTLTEGHSPRVAPGGHLVFARGFWIRGELWAARLDVERSSLGGPVRVLEGHRSGGLEPNATAYFALAEDGTLVYLPAERPRQEMVWVDREGRVDSILDLSDPRLPPAIKNIHAPRLSPDGSRVVFTGIIDFDEPTGYRLYLYDFGRQVLNAVTPGEGGGGDWAVWTPDGRELVFNRLFDGGQDLYRARADDVGSPRALLPPNPYQQHAQAFSPDGRYLVVQHREAVRRADSDLLVLDLDDADTLRPGPLVATRHFEKHASLDRTGRWLAYVSDESGEDQVYVTGFPRGEGRMRISTESAFAPVWSPRGGELFYRRARDDAVIGVPFGAGPELEPGSPRVVVEGGYYTCCSWGRSYDVAPDGRRFLMLTAMRGLSSHVEIVRNWLPDVKRRLEGRADES